MFSAKRAVIIATAYLIIYVVSLELMGLCRIVFILFGLSPILLIWMVYVVLKEKGFEYPELKDEEEWGYLDQPKEGL
ncbi:hypothetical protein AAKU52_002116 [Pedobacter sp. CG_S7]|uniref:hypothetical protein n=1 Tax=Pedobacter sp. CG_S7 TaxID=3143930 RepID=UPI003393A16A